MPTLDPIRPPGFTPKLKPGFGMCDEDGHHRYCWIVEPRERIGNVTHGKCADCKRKGEA